MSTDIVLATAAGRRDAEYRVAVWACPEVPGPTLDPRDIVNGRHRNFSYGWTWWSARHIVLLPADMTLLDALAADGPVEVTVWADVDPLDSGLDEIHQRFDAAWASRKPEQREVEPGDLCEEVAADAEDYFRLARDIHRREHGLPRAVVRSDDYGRQPLYFLRHTWPVGTFMQGGKTSKPVPATPEEIADPDVITHDGRKIVHPGVFIEAFPRDPATFLRGEGATFADAEDALWAKWQRIIACPGHEYETRGYTNGLGFCRHCNLSTSGVFDLAEIGSTCVVCGVGTNWSYVHRYDTDGNEVRGEYEKVCEEHCPPTYLDVVTDLDEDGAPGPDTSWFADFLPAGVPVAEVDPQSLHDAVERGRRAWVDRTLAERVDDSGS